MTFEKLSNLETAIPAHAGIQQFSWRNAGIRPALSLRGLVKKEFFG
jgi:hypothetical protein